MRFFPDQFAINLVHLVQRKCSLIANTFKFKKCQKALIIIAKIHLRNKNYLHSSWFLLIKPQANKLPSYRCLQFDLTKKNFDKIELLFCIHTDIYRRLGIESTALTNEIKIN